MTSNLKYYIYAYIRSQDTLTDKSGTPYYIGKGTGKRAWTKSKGEIGKPSNNMYIVIMESNLTEIGALALERRYIKWYGRLNLNEGTLRNKTPGGDGIDSDTAKRLAKKQFENGTHNFIGLNEKKVLNGTHPGVGPDKNKLSASRELVVEVKELFKTLKLKQPPCVHTKSNTWLEEMKLTLTKVINNEIPAPLFTHYRKGKPGKSPSAETRLKSSNTQKGKPKLQFFTIIKTKKTYNKSNLSKYHPEFKQYY